MAEIKQTNILAKLRSGALGKTVLWTGTNKKTYVRKKYTDTKSHPGQDAWREQYKIVDEFWKELTTEEKNTWRRFRWRPAWSNYAHFMSQNLNRIKAGLPLLRIPE